ncbi:MAG: pitrilysin family protein, partial [Chloroflexota bacterium]
MKKWLILISLLLAVNVVAQGEQVLDYQQYELENGLEVILVRDVSAPVVAVDVWYRVGGANDPEGRSGFAHLFEHMMFQGTANLPKGELDRLVESAGGFLNAYIAVDRTAYYEALPSHQLPLGLWLEADRMASLAVTRTNLDNQRAVVIEEFQQRYGNSPYGFGILELLTRPYNYEPYQTPVIGNIDDLNKATLEEIRAFHDTYYVPNNATLAVVGDIDFDETRDLVEQFFGEIPRGETPPQLPEWEMTEQPEADFVTIEDDLIRTPAVLIGYETPPRQHPDYPALQIVNYVLSSGASSRLAAALTDTGLATSANTVVLDNYGPSLFGVILLPNGDVTLDAVETAFYEELERLASESVDEVELDKAINQLRAESISGLETAFALAESVQAANFYYDDPEAVFTEINAFSAVTPDDITRVIETYLAPTDRHVIYVESGDPVVADDPQPAISAVGDETDDEFEVDFALSITEPPAPLPVTEFNFPTISELTLDNGMELVVIESPELPVISASLYMRGGASLVSPEQTGLADMTATLLTRGTETRTAQELAGTIEQEGGSIGASASNDSLSISMFALSEDTPLVFELLGDVVFNASFPQEELDVAMQRFETSLENTLADPTALAPRAFSRLVYEDHPYGNVTTLNTLANIDREDVVDYYASLAHPENAFLIVSGDITTDAALELAEATFGDWSVEGEPSTVTFAPLEEDEPGVSYYLVDVPGAAQAQIVLGNIGIDGANPDRYTLSVLNNILGSGFQSRLFQNIREDKGYSYSIGSRFNYPVDIGTFRISTSVRSDTVDEALTEIFYEVERIQDEPVGERELTDTQSGMIGRYALQLERTAAYANQIAAFKLRGIPASDLSIYPGEVAAVSAESLQMMAQTYIPDNLIVVVSGDAEVLLPELENITDDVTLLEAE